VFRERLAAEFGPYASLSDAQLSSLQKHYQLLERWNKSINLTRIRNLDDAVRLHYCESLFAGQSLPSGPLSVIDIGSGGGFPGIPIAILRPELRMELLESHQRKAVFLKEASRLLPNVEVKAVRAQAVSGSFDWLISRAVEPREVLSLRVAPNIALLTSVAELQGLPSPDRVVAVPWGNQRVVAMFHVEHLSA
jgi:16S rRNA (guanine527-N7)-methyltransferase